MSTSRIFANVSCPSSKSSDLLAKWQPSRSALRQWFSGFSESDRSNVAMLYLILPCMLMLAPVLAQIAGGSRAGSFEEGKAESALPILLELASRCAFGRQFMPANRHRLHAVQDLAHAEKFYREAVRLNPQFHAARKNLGTVLWFLNRRDESEREFLVVTKSLPADPVPHLYLGLAAAARHEFPQAKRRIRASRNPRLRESRGHSACFWNPISLPAI